MRVIILFLLSFCVAAVQTFAVGLDSLLNSKIKMQKPYLILNITSTECITCRAGFANILNNITDSQLKKKIIILSDDKNMSFYLRQNPQIYGGYKTIYDKELSAALALGPSATVSLIQNSGAHTYLVNKTDYDTINYLKQILATASVSTDYTRFKIKDSVFNNPTNLFFGNKKAILFNSQFQVALQFDFEKNIATYMQPQYNDSTIETLNRIISPHMSKELTDAQFAREELRGMGLEQITIHGLNLNSSTVLFKQYSVSMEIKNDFKDTATFSMPQILLAQNDDNNELFKLNKSAAFFFIDSLHYRGDVLEPLFSHGYQIFDGNFFIPYWDIQHSKSNNVNGREIKQATCMYIVKYKNYAKDKKWGYDIFKIYDTTKGPGTFFFRIDKEGNPVIISATNQTITNLGKNTTQNYSDFHSDNEETIKKFFDISFTKDTMWFAAVTDKSNYVKGCTSLKSGTTKMEKLSTQVLYESMRINGKELLGCKRNTETDELFFDVFSLN